MKKRMLTALVLMMICATGCTKSASSPSSSASPAASAQPQNTADSVVLPEGFTAKDVVISFEDSEFHLGDNPVALLKTLDSNGWKFSGSSIIDGSSLRIDFEHDSYGQNMSICLKSEEDLGSVHKEIVDGIYTKEYSAAENTQIYSVDVEVPSMDVIDYNLKFKIGDAGIGSAKDDVIRMLDMFSKNVNQNERKDDSTGTVSCSANATYYYNEGNSFADFTFRINKNEDKCYGARVVWVEKE